MHRRLPFLPSRRPKATFGGMMAATNLFERSPFARVRADVPVTVYDVGARRRRGLVPYVRTTARLLR